MMDDTSTLTERKNTTKQRDVSFSRSEIIDLVAPRQKSPIKIVVDKNQKKPPRQHKTIQEKNLPLSRINLIKLTEKLAEDAKSGKLKGLGGFADYEGGYMLGLEGSYLSDPESAALPLLRLHRRIMNQIESED